MVVKKKKKKIKSKFDISETNKDLMRKVPLLGFIICKMKPRIVYEIPTAGISKDCQLLLNEKYFNSINELERVAVFNHEALHVAHRHFDRLESVDNMIVAEIAKEVSINQYIENLPGKDHPTVEMFNLQKGMSLEQYYQELLKKYNDNPKLFIKKAGKNPLKGDAKHIRAAKPIGEKIVKDAKEYEKSIGKCSSDILEEVEILPTDYKAKVDRLVGCQPSITKIKRTFCRKSKRFPRSPGSKKELELGDIIFGLDTSGSMSDVDIGKAIDVMKKLKRKCRKVTLIQGDTEVKGVERIPSSIDRLKVKGRGGTELTPIVDKAREMGYPKVPLIMYTDGEVYKFPKDLKNSIWLFTQRNTALEFKKRRPEITYALVL